VIRRGKRWNWGAKVKIGKNPIAGGAFYDLDEFTDATIQQWQAHGRATRDFHTALYFDLAGQRAARQPEISAALRQVQPITVPLDTWHRIVNFKYCLNPLSPAGSLLWVGGRFNVGREIDETRFPSFPALYVAEDFETAFREYHGLAKDKLVEGLRADELSLEEAGSWVTLRLVGCIYNVFDLTKSSNLKGICRIFSKFNLSSRVRDLERKAKRQPTRLIRTPTELVDVMMSDDWRAWPVHFSVPANSQVFARFLVDAGFEGVLYRSAKGAKKCLAVFTRQMVNSNSHVGLHPDRPDNIENAELNSTNCLDL
jgi:hypothetical protein